MKKEHINIEIAKLLGFKQEANYWIYPKGWEEHQASTPTYHIPDFIKMLEIVKNLQSTLKYGIPSQFNFNETNINHEE